MLTFDFLWGGESHAACTYISTEKDKIWLHEDSVIRLWFTTLYTCFDKILSKNDLGAVRCTI